MPSYRLIASRFPTVGLFDAIADPGDLDAVFAIEGLTNPRLRDERSDISLLPKEERLIGPGASLIMAAFTHLNPDGSRFSDGRYGVYYAAASVECALAEVSYHRGKFLASTSEAAIDVDLRLVLADLDAPLHDLRGLRKRAAELYDPNRYAAAQSLGRGLHAAGSYGVVYGSVRHETGVCVGVFRPTALRNARADRHYCLHWDGEHISHWYEKSAPTRVTAALAAPDSETSRSIS